MEGQSTLDHLSLMDLITHNWKTGMRIFLTSCDFDLWQFVFDGQMNSTIERGSWDDQTKKAHSLIAKAMNVLYCFMGEMKYTRVSRCTSAQEICEL